MSLLIYLISLLKMQWGGRGVYGIPLSILPVVLKIFRSQTVLVCIQSREREPLSTLSHLGSIF